MKDLTLIEKQSLPILNCLEYMIETDSAILITKGSSKTKRYKVTFGDIIFPSPDLGKLGNLYNVSNYLNKNGVLFKIDFDLINHHPLEFIEGDVYTEDMVQLGSLEGQSLQSIKKSIITLKEKITGRDLASSKNKSTRIVFEIKTNSLIIGNSSIVFDPDTLDWALITKLVELGANGQTVLSWDEILDFHNGTTFSGKPSVGRKQVGDSRARVNNKIKKSSDLKDDLIARKKNRYSLTKKVIKK